MPVLVTLLCGITASALATSAARNWEGARLRAETARRAAALVERVRRQAEVNLQLVEATAAFLGASDDVTRLDFRDFAKVALAKLDTVRAIAWAPIVRSSERGQMEQRAREDRLPGFTFLDAGPDGGSSRLPFARRTSRSTMWNRWKSPLLLEGAI